jgi:hypothetical protein
MSLEGLENIWPGQYRRGAPVLEGHAIATRAAARHRCVPGEAVFPRFVGSPLRILMWRGWIRSAGANNVLGEHGEAAPDGRSRSRAFDAAGEGRVGADLSEVHGHTPGGNRPARRPDRAELMRLAAQRVLEAPGMIEQAVNQEIFRSEKNRAHLMARHVRRQARRRTQPD